MPFFKPRAPPQNDVDVLLDSIGNGQYDDNTIDELQRIADLSDDSEIDRIAETLLSIIMRTDDRNVLIGTVKGLTVLPFLPEGKDEDVIRLMVTLFAVPQNTRITVQHKMLQNEILKFLISMLRIDERYAKLMMSELIASLEYAYIADDSLAFIALEMLANRRPEFFRPHTETLVKLLGSINKTTRAQSAKLIGVIGTKYPEYVSSAMPVLQSLASFYPDAQVKHNASEAYQILYHGLRLDVVDTVSMKEDDKPRQRSIGFAEILKKKASELLSKPPHETPGERQRAIRSAARERVSKERGTSHYMTGGFGDKMTGGAGHHMTGGSSHRPTGNDSIGGEHMTKPPTQQAVDSDSDEIRLADMEGFETEIKDILDKTRDEFANNAEGILDSIGVGHLTVKNKNKLAANKAVSISKDATAGDGGVAEEAVEAPRIPIHARSSHLDGMSTPRTLAEHDASSRVLDSGDAAEHQKSARKDKKHHEEIGPETKPKPVSSHDTQSQSSKAGLEADLQSRLAARNIEKPRKTSRASRDKAAAGKKLSHDAIALPGKISHDSHTRPPTPIKLERATAKEPEKPVSITALPEIKGSEQVTTPAAEPKKPIGAEPIKVVTSIKIIEPEKPATPEPIKTAETQTDLAKTKPETPIPAEPMKIEATPITLTEPEKPATPEPIKTTETPITLTGLAKIAPEKSAIQEPIKTAETPITLTEPVKAALSEPIKAVETPITFTGFAKLEPGKQITPEPIKTDGMTSRSEVQDPAGIRTGGPASRPTDELIPSLDASVKQDMLPTEPAYLKEAGQAGQAGPEPLMPGGVYEKVAQPSKRLEKALAWADKPGAKAQPKTMETPPAGDPSQKHDEPAAKRVKNVLAWFEKVHAPEQEQPKIERQPSVVHGSTREIIKARPDPSVIIPKPAPPQHTNAEAHTTPPHVKPAPAPKQHLNQPQARPENKQDQAKIEKPVGKPVQPKPERKIESSVLPPRAAVSKHEKAWSSDPITPPVARKIGVSKIGMTDKPLEGMEHGKKETIVPGTSISGFGPNKRVYSCPKCGGRTLVEGDLCKICKMTLEHPQETVRCERCGLINNRSVRFCRKCGAKLENEKA